jgi:hypothetical protein
LQDKSSLSLSLSFRSWFCFSFFPSDFSFRFRFICDFFCFFVVKTLLVVSMKTEPLLVKRRTMSCNKPCIRKKRDSFWCHKKGSRGKISWQAKRSHGKWERQAKMQAVC